MLAEQVRQDQLTNDLANAATPGYKPDRSVQSSFPRPAAVEHGDRAADRAARHRCDDLEGGHRHDPGAASSRPASRSTSRSRAPASSPIRTPQGIRYTRDGQFSANAQGLLVDTQGNQVLGQGGAPIRVGAKGTVPASALGVFNVPGARKQGNNLFTGAAAGRGTGTVVQGELEGSGADPVHTMVDMIGSMRAYEAGQKAIQSIDETLQQSATSVGSLGGGG